MANKKIYVIINSYPAYENNGEIVFCNTIAKIYSNRQKAEQEVKRLNRFCKILESYKLEVHDFIED